MATEAQYNFFKVVYDEENQRYQRLGTRASLYFTIISFFLGTIIFKFDDLNKFLAMFGIPILIYLVIGATLVVALLFTISAVCIRAYAPICDGDMILRGYAEACPTDADFYDERIADFVHATRVNAKQNSNVARRLKHSSYSLFFAAILQLIVFGIAMENKLAASLFASKEVQAMSRRSN